MDYHSIHGHDISSFATPSSHRLPTVRASQALEDLSNDPSVHLSTGLDSLDQALLGPSPVGYHSSANSGGVKRGQVTELWGPPGTGKTALGMQLASNSIREGQGVVWVDCFQPISDRRLKHVVEVAGGINDRTHDDEPKRGDPASFIRLNCLTLPHFIALVSRPTVSKIPSDTALVVISGVTALINSTLPKTHHARTISRMAKGPSPMAKRRQALQCIMKALQTLALTRNCAVVILSQCVTQMQSERGAVLKPAVNATVWEQSVSTRIALFRDWGEQDEKSDSIFLAGIQKLDGKTNQDVIEHVSAFKVEPTGIEGEPYESTGHPIVMQPKRKLGHTDFEIPDSEDDEDYGWAQEDDAALPPPPSQWQGSEDLILGQDVGRSEANDEDEDEEASGSVNDSDND